jgi:glyoxylase-like metal-dependent hydrolase (beta-lactamase superfamily II)
VVSGIDCVVGFCALVGAGTLCFERGPRGFFMRLRIFGFMLGCVALLAVTAPSSHAQAPTQSPERSITRISGDLYRAQNNRHFTVFLVTPDGIVLADPINTEFALWLKSELKERFKSSVKYVLYSHSHWDHASGGKVFADTALFIGHRNMLDHLKPPAGSTPLAPEMAAIDSDGSGTIEIGEAGGRLRSDFALYDFDGDGTLTGAEIARGPLADVRPPDIVYDQRMAVRLGGRTVELSWTGPITHSDDMSVMHFPDEQTIYVVDFLQIKSLPYGRLGSGFLDEWLESIRAIEEMDFSIVAPGHNVLGTKADVQNFRGYLQDLRAAVAAGIESGSSVEELQDTVRMEKYADWFMYDSWRKDNVAGMYDLLRKAAGE